MGFDVFLCHNSSDKDAVKKIGRRLKAAKLKPWLDEWDSQPGLPWVTEVEKQIATVAAAAVFVGKEGIGKWQQLERMALLHQLVDRECPVIPVILPGAPPLPDLPAFLKELTWVDFREKDPDPLERLIWGITGEKPGAASPPENKALPLNNLPSSSLGELFKGREDLLSELEKNLDPKTPTALVQAQTVKGLGGVGKTRLAIEYAYRNAEHFSAIFFVNADNEAELRRNFAALAGRTLLSLGLSPEAAEDVLLEEVRVALRHQPGWLLILDNVDSKEAQQAVRRVLPLAGGHVLITSRLQHWPPQMKQLQVDKLEPKAAREYLLKASETGPRQTGEEAAADQLAEKLDYLPLALELSAAYVRENNVSFGELVANWEKEQEKVLEWYDEGITEYPRSLAATWSRSFEQLNLGAQAVLKVLAHLAPEPIPQAMLEKGEVLLREAANGEFDLPAALIDLQRYSLLKREQRGEQKTVILHRLVQAVARGRIAAEEKAAWAKRGVRLVYKFAPPESEDVRTWPIWDPLRPHALRVVELAEAAGVDRPTSALMGNLAWFLKTKALYTEAEPLMRRALAIDEVKLGKIHPNVATHLNNLALLLHDTYRLVEAEPLMRRALAIDQASYGKDHPRVAIDLGNLAQLLRATNRLAEAESLMRRSLTIDEANFVKEHQEVARSLNNLAVLLHSTDRHAEAEPLIRRALAIAEAKFGKDHPRSALYLQNLAQLLKATKRHDKAEPLMRQSLAINQENFGKDHPIVSRTLNNLAMLLQAMNRFAEAEPLMRRSLAINEASFGKTHPDVAICLNNLARLLQDMDRLAEAEPLMRRSLAILQASLGKDHPSTVTSQENLALLLAEIEALQSDKE